MAVVETEADVSERHFSQGRSGWRDRLLSLPEFDFLWVSVIFVALAVIYRLLTINVVTMDPDEFAFALVGREVLHGRLPNTAIFDNKPVGLTYIFTFAELLFGQTTAAVRSVGFFASTACAGLLYAASRSLKLSTGAALAFAALFMLLALNLGGISSMSELIACPLLAAANYLVVRGQSRSAMTLLGIGAAFGLACQITYLAAPPAAFTLAGLVLLGPVRPIQERIREAAWLGLGGSAAVLAVWVPQMMTGGWINYLVEEAHYHQSYRRASTDWMLWAHGFGLPLFRLALPVLITAGLHARYCGLDPRKVTPTCWLFGLQLLGALLAASASNRYYVHYLILALPSAGMLGAGLLAGTPQTGRRLGTAALILPLALSAGAPLPYIYGKLREPSIDLAAVSVVDHLTRPQQSIFIFDEAHTIYFLAKRQAASRYVFPNHYLSSCENTPMRPVIASSAVLAQALASRPALVLVGEGCPSDIDADAQVRKAGYRPVDDIKEDGRRIVFYAPA